MGLPPSHCKGPVSGGLITRLTAVFRARQALQATRVPMERFSAPLPASSAMDAPHSGLPCAHDVA